MGRRKTVLSLDGGGVRGIVSVAFLLRLEALLAKSGTGSEGEQNTVRLCDRFDLIGGTSTGSIIATALAIGFSAADIREFYFQLAANVFRKSPFRMLGFQHVFDGGRLRAELEAILGPMTLDSDRLSTGLAIVMKRVDTGSPWIVSNNPHSKYWDDSPDGSYIGNRHYRLVDLVRASTAAPHYFSPEVIQIAEKFPPGLFADGGVTPHNNPSLALLQLATIPVHGYNWKTGLENLTIVSIGTGAFRKKLNIRTAARTPAVLLAVKGLLGLIKDTEAQALTMMQLLGRPVCPVHINEELGDLQNVSLTPEPLFSFQRYDVRLETDWIAQNLGQKLSERQLAALRRMDDPAIIADVFALAQEAADSQIDESHIQHLFSGPNAERSR